MCDNNDVHVYIHVVPPGLHTHTQHTHMHTHTHAHTHAKLSCCSLYLHKLGKAPLIEDLLGTATFTGTYIHLYIYICTYTCILAYI